ncbi:winged helix-turn-helix domain-containing protein [Methanolobus sp. ZRKC2]|uniref:helix-turn-helix transcriptional regulator n=1 Tax=Methanolobus sp. ZRKC2 TaxID=3125783 RepID=UPI0032449780
MKKPLIDVVFASEKRKKVLLLLNSGPKVMKTILKHLKTNRPALLPQIRILEDYHLITQFNDVYQLTTIGKLVVDEIEPFLKTVDILDIDIDYWGTRNLEFLPKNLLERISELGDCEITEPSSMDLHGINNDFRDRTFESSSASFICRFLYPDFDSLLNEWIEKQVQISMIVDNELLKRIKESHAKEFMNCINTGSFELFLYPDNIEFMKFAQNDHCIMLMLFNEKLQYDNKTLLSFNRNSSEWGKEFFENYKQRSMLISDI